jgi:hypothetical protein
MSDVYNAQHALTALSVRVPGLLVPVPPVDPRIGIIKRNSLPSKAVEVAVRTGNCILHPVIEITF